jgi:hypothetical protein
MCRTHGYLQLLTGIAPPVALPFPVVESSAQSRRGRRALRIGAVVVLAFAVAVGVWLGIRNRNDGNHPASTSSSTQPAVHSSVGRATAQSLTALSRLQRRPIYWAGPSRRTKLELTQTTNGRIYVRYLPQKVKIGDRRGRYLIIGTYRVPNAYRAIQNAAKEPGAHLIRLRGRTLAVYNESSRTNVYFALPNSNYQVEVYDPNPNRALALVRSGKIRPIRLRSAGG